MQGCEPPSRMRKQRVRCRKEQGHDQTWEGRNEQGEGEGAFTHLTVEETEAQNVEMI